MPQIHICSAAVAVDAVLLSPHRRPVIAAKPSFLRRCFSCIDFVAAYLPPLPPGPVSRVFAAVFCCCLAADIFVADATVKLSSLRHRVGTSVDVVLP